MTYLLNSDVILHVAFTGKEKGKRKKEKGKRNAWFDYSSKVVLLPFPLL